MFKILRNIVCVFLLSFFIVFPSFAFEKGDIILVDCASSVYESPEWASYIVGRIEQGNAIKIEEVEGSWYKIEYEEEKFGWVQHAGVLNSDEIKRALDADSTLTTVDSDIYTDDKLNLITAPVSQETKVEDLEAYPKEIHRGPNSAIGITSFGGITLKGEFKYPLNSKNNYHSINLDCIPSKGFIASLNENYYPNGNTDDGFAWYYGFGIGSYWYHDFPSEVCLTANLGGRLKLFESVQPFSKVAPLIEISSVVSHKDSVVMMKLMTEFDLDYTLAAAASFIVGVFLSGAYIPTWY